MFNKNAQIAETMTWVVATIVIIVVLSFSILVSVNIFDDKEFEVKRNSDLLATKSLTSFLLTEKDGKKVFEQLKEEENLNDFNGNLALKIFQDFYEKDYDVWLGFVYPEKIIGYWKKNDFFSRPRIQKGGDIGLGYRYFIIEEIKLTNEKSIELMIEKNEK